MNMKKTVVLILLVITSLSAFGQKNPIDQLFDEYEGKDGFTSIYISSKLFSLMARADLDDEELQDLLKGLKSIRILSVDDEELNQKLNFYDKLEGNLDFSDYEELMVVKEGGKDLKFLIKEKGVRIEELLMISGGPGSNVLISIKGDLDMDNISDISNAMGLDDLNEINNKNTKKNEL